METKKIQTKLFRTDTKALVGAVIMGIVFLVMMQVTGRIDAVLDPTLLLFNGTCWALFTGLIVLMYKQPAGIIGAILEAVVAMATGYSTLAFFFIAANLAGSVVFSLISSRFSMEKWLHHFAAQLGCNVSGNLCVMVGLMIVFKLPLPAAALSSLITISVGTVGATLLQKPIYEALKKSSLL